MGLDSSAELLFKVNANADDATGNIQRFRSLLSKDLGDLKGEFDSWATKVFGNLTSVKAGMLAGTAAIAAGVVAVEEVISRSTAKYIDYASEVAKGSRLTGIGAEDMSKLRFAAKMVGTDYDQLVVGLTRFASSIVKANEGSEKAATAFHRLRIEDTDLQAGQQNMLPLLYKVSDAFHDSKSKVEQLAMSRELFSRGGSELLTFLSRGSEGLRELGKEAERLGLVLADKDLKALKEYKTALKELKAQQEALDLYIGQQSMPVMIKWAAAKVATIEMIRQAPGGPLLEPWKWIEWTKEYEKATERIKGLMKVSPGAEQPLAPPAETTQKVKAVRQEYEQLSQILEQVRNRTAGAMGDDAKILSEIEHIQIEGNKAAAELNKLQKEGKVTAESYQREMAALGKLPDMLDELARKEFAKLEDKRQLAIRQATEELQRRLSGLAEQTFEGRRAEVDNEIALLRTKLEKEKTLTAENVALMEQIRKASLQRIANEQFSGFIQELRGLQGELANMLTARMTPGERTEFNYEQDLQKYSQAKEAEALKLAQSEEEKNAIIQQYGMNREALLQKFGADMMALQNSQGWEGVFGSQFAQLIQNDQELLREWSESADQAMLMVRVAAEGTEQIMQRGFHSFAQGMGSAIASAIVYKNSIGEAMRSAAAASLQSIAAEALIQAIYSTGLGFVRLAQHDYPAASSAFTAAAIFGSVGVAAAVAGRAIAPPQKGAQAGAADSAGVSGSASGTSAQDAQEAQPRVTVIVNGHVVGPSGIEELTEMINDAVLGRDVQLFSTASKQSAQVVR